MIATKKEFWLSVALAAIVGLGIGYFVSQKSSGTKNITTPTVVTPNTPNNLTPPKPGGGNNNLANNNIPDGEVPGYVLEVYDYVTKNKKAMDGYVGGRIFQNREGILPKGASYQEWDVKPKVQGQNRGAERLVTSAQGDGYYTSDHYRTFTKFK
jgi:guanyl-specific ribonuclease Sa